MKIKMMWALCGWLGAASAAAAQEFRPPWKGVRVAVNKSPTDVVLNALSVDGDTVYALAELGDVHKPNYFEVNPLGQMLSVSWIYLPAAAPRIATTDDPVQMESIDDAFSPLFEGAVVTVNLTTGMFSEDLIPLKSKYPNATITPLRPEQALLQTRGETHPGLVVSLDSVPQQPGEFSLRFEFTYAGLRQAACAIKELRDIAPVGSDANVMTLVSGDIAMYYRVLAFNGSTKGENDTWSGDQQVHSETRSIIASRSFLPGGHHLVAVEDRILKLAGIHPCTDDSQSWKLRRRIRALKQENEPIDDLTHLMLKIRNDGGVAPPHIQVLINSQMPPSNPLPPWIPLDLDLGPLPQRPGLPPGVGIELPSIPMPGLPPRRVF